MRALLAGCFVLLLTHLTIAQDRSATSEPKSTTVSATVDHNRVVIEADVLLPNRTWQSIRAWVDNGNPDLYMSRRLANLLGLNVTCGDKECSAPPPPEIAIGGMTIALTALKEAKIPLRTVSAAAVLAAGMNADINLPSSVLRHYDVLVDFPERRFSIGQPGTIHFRGASGKVQINPENGLIQIPSQIDRKKYNLALDLGSSISFLSDDVFAAMGTAHPDWPQMTGAIGPANMWGAPDEAKWNLMRIDRVQYGPLFLTDVAFVSFPKEFRSFFEKRAGIPTAGLLGSDALLNYRVGLDYAHSTVYFDIGRTFKFPAFDVVGLVLSPREDGNYAILGVADFDGKPAVDGVQPGDLLLTVNDIPVRGVTMGQVWSMLGGTPGQERKLTLHRSGREISVIATVQHFLPEVPDDQGKKKKK